MSSTIHSGIGLNARTVPQAGETLDAVASAFGIAAVTAILFNTVLAWVKDAYDSLNSFMAHRPSLDHARPPRPAGVLRSGLRADAAPGRHGWHTDGSALAGSVVLAGGGLALWFLLV
jgi:hypothetical protein